MIKRILTTATAIVTVLAGIVCAAPSASAQENGFACRSDNTPNHSWANWSSNNLDSCIAYDANDPSVIWAGVGVNNYFTTDPCAQLVDASTGRWLYDYGCADKWTGSWVPGSSGNHYFNIRSADLGKTGHPVYVQVGFWANFGSGLQYYMNVQSPTLWF
ncbi:hypothetical protein OU787_33565 [Kitasatospora sp. YST-16]|uniref:hypothetical protein n=1 Tax=Kitasatospora sp. YST-16 TaxID=2998080 RepID=UPI002284A057|nr:hypothetical protein [Kitasatospora sp. YST-16]WAL76048.1 hypothetical protein OU787_33565 [Kitasatospora sp. YST-16]WNW42101.1 hypothetical protein RKE32_33455 [Streptomyces sp. Li-HN-5-13]